MVIIHIFWFFACGREYLPQALDPAPLISIMQGEILVGVGIPQV